MAFLSEMVKIEYIEIFVERLTEETFLKQIPSMMLTKDPSEIFRKN
jgi:hypothetical protein